MESCSVGWKRFLWIISGGASIAPSFTCLIRSSVKPGPFHAVRPYWSASTLETSGKTGHTYASTTGSTNSLKHSLSKFYPTKCRCISSSIHTHLSWRECACTRIDNDLPRRWKFTILFLHQKHRVCAKWNVRPFLKPGSVIGTHSSVNNLLMWFNVIVHQPPVVCASPVPW